MDHFPSAKKPIFSDRTNGPILRFTPGTLSPCSIPSELRKLFGGGPRQAILAGDFNAPVARPEMTTILEKWTNVDAIKLTPTIPVSKPTLKIDYIFIQQDSPLKVLSSEVLNEPIASDHLPLVATLK